MTEGSLDATGLIVADRERSVRFRRRPGAPFPDGAGRSEHGPDGPAGGPRLR